LACDKERCVKWRKDTEKNCTWKGFMKTPEMLYIEIKTYEREVSADEQTNYNFLFSDISIDRRIHAPNVGHKHTTRYRLQVVVKLEGEGHKSAVVFVRLGKHRWWKCVTSNRRNSTLDEGVGIERQPTTTSEGNNHRRALIT
jgi:hypothetical protein